MLLLVDLDNTLVDRASAFNLWAADFVGSPAIFHIAAHRLGTELAGGWMVGDHPTADIAGGRAAGLKTGWVSRSKEWPGEMAAPDLSAATAAEVIHAVILPDARERRSPSLKESPTEGQRRQNIDAE